MAEGNEVIITITAEDATKATKDQVAASMVDLSKSGGATVPITAANRTGPVMDELRASYLEFEKTFQPIGLKATNPINEAFMAQVRSSIKALSGQALEIPIEPDTLAFREQLEAQLLELSSVERADIPLEVANAQEFRASVLEQVNAVSQQTKVVVDIETNDASLVDLREKILAAADASAVEVKAQQDLASALRAANASGAAKDQEALAQAELQAADAAAMSAKAQEELAAAEEAATVGEEALAAGADTAKTSMAGLGAAMGPLWMVMNVVQIAMMGLGTGMFGASQQSQNLSQQLISLGQATGSGAMGMLTGNQALQQLNQQMLTVGTNAPAFAQAFTGGIGTATDYTNQLQQAQANLGATMVTTTQKVLDSTGPNQKVTESTQSVTTSIADLAKQVNGGNIALSSLPPTIQAQVNEWNNLGQVLPQAQTQLKAMQQAQAIAAAQLDALGVSLSTSQQLWNGYGNTVQTNVQMFNQATSGLKYLFDSVNSSDIAAGQAAQSWTQLQQAVTTAQQAYQQAAAGVANADHSVEQAALAVDAARHSEEQSILAVGQAELQLANAQTAETTAQTNLTLARQQAADQLKALQLQVADQADTELAAKLRLEQAQNAVNMAGLQGMTLSKLGDPNANNAAAYQLLLNLSQAQNALNDANQQGVVLNRQNADAQKLGVDGATNVVSAQQQLLSSQQAVATAAQGVANATYAQQQASLAVQNALYSQQQASLAVQTAQEAEHAATLALTTAKDNATRSTDGNSLASAQNRTTIEGLYEANLKVYGPTIQAAQATEQQGSAAGFTATQVDSVITSLGGLNGQVSTFSIVGTPSMDLYALIGQATSQGIDPALLGISQSAINANIGSGVFHAAGGPIAGPGGGTDDLIPAMLSNGEHVWTADEVQKAGGHQAVEAMRSAVRGYAGGGSVGQQMLGANYGLLLADNAAQAVADVMTRFGQHPQPPHLPTGSGAIDFSSLLGAAGGTANLAGINGSNEQIMQQVFAQHGWAGAEWAAAYQLEMMEAGFNNTAQNPTSTAYGMGQFLDSTWAGYGIPKTSDPALQSEAMARYISQRYGDPLGALAHENAFHWYSGGGPAGGLIGVGEDGPELLRVPAGSSVRPAANTAHDMGSVATLPELKVSLDIAGDGALSTLLLNLFRSGKLRIKQQWITN